VELIRLFFSKECLLFKCILPAFVIISIISLLQMANWLRTLSASYQLPSILFFVLFLLFFCLTFFQLAQVDKKNRQILYHAVHKG